MPGAPKHPRKRKQITRPDLQICGPRNSFWRLWNDPATRPMMLERARQNAKKAGRPEGVADGTTKKQIEALRAEAEAKADRILAAMAKDDNEIADMGDDETQMLSYIKAAYDAEALVDDEKATARAAMKEAIVMVLMPGNRQTKLQAIRTVLEYTKARPASTTNTNLSAAEDFLLALASKEK